MIKLFNLLSIFVRTDGDRDPVEVSESEKCNEYSAEANDFYAQTLNRWDSR